MPALRIDRIDSAKVVDGAKVCFQVVGHGKLSVCGLRAALARLPPERSTAHSVRPVPGASVLFLGAHRPG